MKRLRNIWDWVWGQFVGEVPEDEAFCEFHCRKPQCTEGEWEELHAPLAAGGRGIDASEGTRLKGRGGIDACE